MIFGLGNHATCTLFRKSAVSKVHQWCPAMKANLADLMCHRQETANRCYRAVNREETSVSASRKLTELMNDGQLQNNQNLDDDAVNDNDPDITLEVEKAAAVVPDDSRPTDASLAEHVRRTKLFSKNDVHIINTACHDIIAGGSMSKDRISKALMKNAEGSKLLERYSCSQLVTRLTYERRRKW